MTSLWTLLFVLIVGVLLPALAALTWRQVRTAIPEENSPALLYLQTVLIQGVVAVLGLLVLRAEGLRMAWGRPSPWGVIAAVGLVGLALGVSGWRRRLGRGSEQVAALLRPRSALDRALWVSTVAWVAVAEEFVYRGVLFRLLGEVTGSGWIAALGSAVIFGLSHLAQGWSGAAITVLFGLGFQAVVALSGGLGLAILAHFAYDVLVELFLGRTAGRHEGRTAV